MVGRAGRGADADPGGMRRLGPGPTFNLPTTVSRRWRPAPGAPPRCDTGESPHQRPVVAPQGECLHNASMTNVLIRDVPEEVHRKLTERAVEMGVSLQHYLTTELTRLAQAPTLDEVIARIEKMSGGSVGFETAVADIEEARAERDSRNSSASSLA